PDCIRVYTSYEDDAPLGIVALNNVDRNMRTGTLWGVAGDKSFRCRGSTQVAASRLLTMAFQELGLHSVNTWTVEHNASRRAVERLGFRFIGRQRQCHFIDGQPYHRLLFDPLASDHRELDPAGLACGVETSWGACGFGEQARARDRISLVEVAGRAGVRLRTLPGDREIAGSGAAERADLALSPEATGCVEGREQWWAHSLLFPSDYELPVVTAADSWPWGVVFDFHHTGSTGQANFQVDVADFPPRLRFAISAGPVVSSGAPGSPTRRWEIGPIVKNRWYDFVYHVKWSAHGDGWFGA